MASTLDRTIERVGEFKNRIRDVFRYVRFYNLTHTEYLREYSEKIYDHPDYKALPRWAVSELSGFRDGLDDWLRADLEPRWGLGGEQFTNGPEKEATFANRWHDVTYDGLYWPGTMIKWYG
jgi:hypothetical protein